MISSLQIILVICVHISNEHYGILGTVARAQTTSLSSSEFCSKTLATCLVPAPRQDRPGRWIARSVLSRLDWPARSTPGERKKMFKAGTG